MAKKIFSAQMWENVPSDIEKTITVSLLAKSEEITPNLMSDIDRVVQEIEKRGIDIAPDYDTWLNVGFALADGLGINGCEVFHRISRLPGMKLRIYLNSRLICNYG